MDRRKPFWKADKIFKESIKFPQQILSKFLSRKKLHCRLSQSSAFINTSFFSCTSGRRVLHLGASSSFGQFKYCYKFIDEKFVNLAFFIPPLCDQTAVFLWPSIQIQKFSLILVIMTTTICLSDGSLTVIQKMIVVWLW